MINEVYMMMFGLIVIGLLFIELSIVINNMIEDMERFRGDMDEFYDENIDEWDAFFEQFDADTK